VAARFSVEAFFKACEDERISEVSLVPVQVKRIVEDPHFAPKRIESLEFTLVSGSLIDLEIKRRLAETWPGRIVEAYGTTETGGIATLDLKANTDKLDTVGRIIDGVELITLNEDGERLPDDAVGEIAAITPMPMVGYFNRDDLTTQSTWHNSEGRRYVRTGDIGYIGEDGFLRITGRAKDMIISGGLNIFACDIEAVLCEHPAIAEAAAIAVPDERWGEAPYAIVVLREHTTASADELMDWMRARLARTSWPTGLEFTRALPRNEMGKVLKRLLREPFWRGRERGVA
jgi:acyl-CoA synthetase (AMP-forming)/AMP-acid ligase II